MRKFVRSAIGVILLGPLGLAARRFALTWCRCWLPAGVRRRLGLLANRVAANTGEFVHLPLRDPCLSQPECDPSAVLPRERADPVANQVTDRLFHDLSTDHRGATSERDL